MKTLKSFQFPAAASGFKSKYDWEQILDGKIHQLEEGSDFTAKTETMATLIRSAAKRRGKSVKVAKVENGLVV
jgi:hypothetical protein